MKTPKELMQDTVLVPVKKLLNNYIGKMKLKTYCNKFADFVFKRSGETAMIMLFFNAVSIISSHLAQIGGLKRSKRENKDYLITQEKKELALDIGLTIIPPFMINRFLEKKLESGQWTTKEAKEKLVNTIAPVVGASRDDLYSTSHIKPVKETLGVFAARITGALLDKKKDPQAESMLKTLDEKIRSTLPDFALITRDPSLTDITTNFDNMVREKRVDRKLTQTLRNGRAYDDLCGQNTGLLIMATLGYTIIASNIIMPVLKNIMANHSYEKQLEKMGETKESIKRKERFKYTKNPVIQDDKNLFNVFSTYDSLQSSGKQKNTFNIEKQKEPEKSVSRFQTFEKYNTIYSQSTGLRI